MIQAIRDKSHGIVAWVAVGFLILMFAMWGVGNYLTSAPLKQRTVATVNGSKITQGELDQAVSALKRNLRTVKPKAFAKHSAELAGKESPKKLRAAQATIYADSNLSNAQQELIKQISLNRLTANKLLYQNAARAGMAVSHAQASEAIVSMPWLQDSSTGTFSQARYQNMLQNIGMNAVSFQSYQSHQMVVGQQNNGLGASELILPHESQHYLALLNQTRDFQYMVIPWQSFANKAVVTSQAIQAYYAKHQAQFMTPTKLKLAYILVSYKTIGTKLKGKTTADQQQKSQAMYAKVGNKLANISFANPGSLKQASEQLKLPIQTTSFFTKNTKSKTLTGILASKKVLAAAWGNQVFKQLYNSNIINISPTEAVVVRIDKLIPGKELPLTQVKPEVTQILTKQAARKLATQHAQALLAQLNGKGIANVSGNWQQHTKVHRDAKDLDSNLLKAVFSAPMPTATHSSNLMVQLKTGNIALVAVTKAKLAKVTPAELKTKLTKTKITKYKQAFAAHTVHSLVALLRQRAKIIVNKAADA